MNHYTTVLQPATRTASQKTFHVGRGTVSKVGRVILRNVLHHIYAIITILQSETGALTCRSVDGAEETFITLPDLSIAPGWQVEQEMLSCPSMAPPHSWSKVNQFHSRNLRRFITIIAAFVRAGGTKWIYENVSVHGTPPANLTNICKHRINESVVEL